NPPLGLATLAALCPADWQVEIVDENIEAVPLAPQADLIGICGMGVQFPRQCELLTYYRGRGYPVVAGGSYASLCPEKYAGLADVVIAGEAEHIWREFCTDYQRGTQRPLYQETGVVNLADSPAPRFDLLKLQHYSSATLQFSRGCPFRCEFCDIIIMFGRKPRVKSLEQVGRELDMLRAQGAVRVFFVDDNLIGNRPACKRLLQYLKEYQDKHNYRFSFGTEASLNLAEDPKLLRLFRDAGFGWVFIGIESPDPESLKETLKTQNLQNDILGAIAAIHAYGVEVLAGFIIGFDNDTLETFEAQYQFITASGIQAAMVGLLQAFPRTPLYERLRQAGRLRVWAHDADNSKLGTNVLPLRMDYDAMVEGYRGLYQRLTTDRNIAQRLTNKMRQLGPPVFTGGFSRRETFTIVARLILKGIVPGGLSRLALFFATFPLRRPSLIAVWVSDWITGLSMQRYVKEHFATPNRDHDLSSRVPAARVALP
ncbi:MAG: radical SAM protein, partial [Gammaproteobacteria bacterium]